MLARIIMLIGLLIAGQVFAIDEDYYIPYTDTYGYEFDPETGKFVKRDQVSTASGNTADKNTIEHTQTDSQPHNNQTVTQAGETSGGNILSRFGIMIGSVMLLLAVFTYWFNKRRKGTSFD